MTTDKRCPKWPIQYDDKSEPVRYHCTACGFSQDTGLTKVTSQISWFIEADRRSAQQAHDSVDMPTSVNEQLSECLDSAGLSAGVSDILKDIAGRKA